MSSPSSELRSFRKTKILKAGAGAGKTTTLVRLFLDFAVDFKLDHGRFPKIVVSTFTRKATQELKERLSNKALDMRSNNASDSDLHKSVVHDLFEYVSTKSLVHISTIHGVLGLFLARYGYMLGLTPDFKIVSDGDLKRQVRRHLRKILISKAEWRDLLEEFDYAALEKVVIENFDSSLVYPDLKRADAVYLLNLREQKWQILQKEAAEVFTAIRNQTEGTKWAEYTEAYLNLSWNKGYEAVRLELEQDERIPRKPPFKREKPPFDEALHEDLEALRKKIDKFLANDAWSEAAISRNDQVSRTVGEVCEIFNKEFLKEKLELGQISMRDMETLSLHLLRTHPDSAVQFSKDWDFWMIDEYQDTSPIQVELLNKLIGDRPAFYVGDPQQSIYLFRGARSKVFQEKVEQIQSSGGDFEQAVNNYRSHKNVLSVFNEYFTRMSPQFGKMTVPQEKVFSDLSFHPLEFWLTDSDEAQNLAVIHKIQKVLQSGVSAEQICVLGRTNSQLEDLARLSVEYGLPVQLHAGGSFFERREVQDILQIMKVLLNPHDNATFLSVLRSPWFFVEDSELTSYCHKFESSFYLKALGLTAGKADHPAQQILKYQRRAEEVGITRTLIEIIHDKELISYSQLLDPSGRREANIWKLISMLSQEERRPGFNFLDFVDEKTGSRDPDTASEDGDATPVIEPKRVNFMTVHASKGLQFEHVMVPWMDNRSRPYVAPVYMVDEMTGVWSIKVKDSDSQEWVSSGLIENLAEARQLEEQKETERVFYVALTRAISGIHLFWKHADKLGGWAALCPFDVSEGIHEFESFTYLVQRDIPEPERSKTTERIRLPVRARYQSDATVQVLLDSDSVTSLLEKQMKAASQSHPKERNLFAGLQRAQQGTDAHRIFESLKYSNLTELLVDQDIETQKALQFICSENEVPLSRIIQNGFAEWGFAIKENGRRFQGQIDLWGVVEGVCYIVDYKTGSQRYSEQAFRQLEFYAWCLLKMKKAQDIPLCLAVVYPFEQTIKRLDYGRIESIKGKVEEFIGSGVAPKL